MKECEEERSLPVLCRPQNLPVPASGGDTVTFSSNDAGRHHCLQRSYLQCLKLLRGRGSFRTKPSLVPHGFTQEAVGSKVGLEQGSPSPALSLSRVTTGGLSGLSPK